MGRRADCQNVRAQIGCNIATYLSGTARTCQRFMFQVGLLISAMALLCSCSTGSPTPTKPKHAVDYSGLIHKVGVYYVGPNTDQLRIASRLGLGLIVGSPVSPNAGYQQILHASGMRVIDSTPARMIYQAFCPSAPDKCARPSGTRLVDLRRQLAKYVRSRRSNSTVAGYYILDDYVPNIDDVLASVYQAMRAADPARPLVCAFSIPVIQVNADAVAVAKEDSLTARHLQNYSPKWCDAVMIFSYAPGSVTPRHDGPYDWAMTKTLPTGLSILRSKGWRQSTSPLIGVPQTFQFWPRRPGPKWVQRVQYREGPTETELTAQVVAFCRAGATSIVAYAWRTTAQKTTRGLVNSSAFQLGLLSGAQQCQRDFWR